jgi:hypothetical protein
MGVAYIYEQPISHETFHMLQSQLGGDLNGVVDTPTNWGPRWLIEGSAQWFQTVYAVHRGTFTFDSAVQANRQFVVGFPAKLKDLESWNGIVAAGPEKSYGLAFLASTMLVSEHGSGAFITYWQAIGLGVGWEQTFAQAFGESPASFYTRFELTRP